MSQKRSKICYVSHAVIASNFQADCHVCYTNDETCSIHDGLHTVTGDDMCNALTIFRNVSIMKYQGHFRHAKCLTFPD